MNITLKKSTLYAIDKSLYTIRNELCHIHTHIIGNLMLNINIFIITTYNNKNITDLMSMVRFSFNNNTHM